MNPKEHDERPLESWKEIAAYLQRDAKTARNWEKQERLPVHRHSHKSRSSVYAYPSEIDTWRASRRVAAESEPGPVNTFWRIPSFALAIVLCVIMVGNGVRPQAASAEPGKATAKRVFVPKAGLDYFTLSPDGQWLGGTDWQNGDLVLTRISSGETRRLVQGHYNYDPNNFNWAESPMLSPDQKQVAYWWFDYADPKEQGQVRLMANQPGAKPRVLVQATTGSDGAYPIGWSPDGKRFLVRLGKLENGRRSRDIAWVTIADGSLQTINTLDPWNSGKGVSFSLSPDGRYLAYSGRIGPDAPDTGIFVISTDHGVRSELVRGGANLTPVWTPDGVHILFSSNRSGAFGVWSVSVRDGKPAGLPVLIRPETSVARPIGISRGRYLYNYNVGLRQIFIAQIDAASGQARPEVAESFVGESPAWSPDGKWIAFKRLTSGVSDRSLVIRSYERGSEWSLVPNLGDDAPLWHRDGTVQFNGSRRRVSISSGTPELVDAAAGAPSGIISPDGKLMYARANGETEALDAVELANTGHKQTFKVPGGVIFFAVSPDGKTLSVMGANGNVIHLGRIGADGSNYKELVSNVTLGLPVWSADGRYLYFGQPESNSPKERIMRIPAEGGQPEFSGIAVDDLKGFDLSPDGKEIAYSGGVTQKEVWALDNVMAALK